MTAPRLTPAMVAALRRIATACQSYDGYGPHGSADWQMIRRLVASGVAAYVGTGVCEDCDTPTHRRDPVEIPIYVLTPAGRDALGHRRGRERGREQMIDTAKVRARYQDNSPVIDPRADVRELCDEIDRWRATATMHHYKHGSSVDAGGCDFCAACDAVAALMPARPLDPHPIGCRCEECK